MAAVDPAAEIVALDRAWEDAIIAVDTAVLERLGAEDLVYTHGDASIEGKPGFIDHIVNGALRFERIDYEDTEIRMRDGAAVLTCALHLETRDQQGHHGQLHFRMTHVWVREPDGWRLLASQSTHLKP